jgi:tetratricopeptide (TPR) repeat protein
LISATRFIPYLSFVFVAASFAACSSSTPPPPEPQKVAAAAMISTTSKSPAAVAQFEKGRDLFDNLRVDEAEVAFAEALKLDPDFQLAHVYHGQTLPGPDGVKEIDAALAASGSLPPAERALIEGNAANRHGEPGKAEAAFTKVTELAPGDWHGHFALGQQLLNNLKFDASVQALKKATSLNPNAGGAQNMLGYAALRQGDADAAVAAFQDYVRILPQEPNPQDSLGEALLAAGRFKDAEAAFRKALDLSPQFWNGHEGIAFARFYAGDWKGGRDALMAAKAAATRVSDKIAMDDELSAAAVAQRDTKTALSILDGIEKTDGADPSDLAFVPLRRAFVLTMAGRHRDALAPAAAAIEKADAGILTAGPARTQRRQALVARITAESALKDVAAATKTSAALDEAAAAAPDSPAAQSAMHYGRGSLAAAGGDVAAARAHFAQCSPLDEFCKWQDVVVAGKGADKAAATAARDQLLKLYLRDPLHLVIWSTMTKPVVQP